ncbi:MAG TPA: histone deacetylase family protein [Burkholderiales bacterium]|nr:histone deacetylase family protein [Burkholderiales bacterium]
MGQNHPESPARIQAIEDQLIAQRLADFLRRVDAPAATTEQLMRAHDPDYVHAIMQCAPETGTVQLDPDTLMMPHSLDAALHSAGAVVAAIDMVLSGEIGNAFCAVRPPGHHAERKRAMGFCLFNNVAVGAAHALAEHGLERVAILDFDVHHGNGTEDIFAGNERVLYCSTYQHPFYPYPEPGLAAPNVTHCPLAAGSNGEVFRESVRNNWFPALDRFHPQLLLLSAGFDGHLLDPLADMRLTDDDYQWITEALVSYANEHCDGRIVSALEGGYDLGALGRCAAVHIKALMGL